MHAQMLGDLRIGTQLFARGGFMPAMLGGHGLTPGPSIPLLTRQSGYEEPRVSEEMIARIDGLRSPDLKRTEIYGTLEQILHDLNVTKGQFERAITSATTSLPIRENLEAEAKNLTPLDTPLRNRLPRKPGAGLASAWRQLTSMGGGYGATTTVTSGASSATQTVGSTAGMAPGDTLYFATTVASRIVSSITNATTVVLTATISTTTAETVTKIGVQPAGGVGALRSFYTESGAPADHASTYAAKSASYKLLGTYGSVTGFAMAAGRNFQDQLNVEKTNQIRNLMLNEENALVNGSSTDVKAPWGDGSTAMGFDGLMNLITTANGTPVDQVQTSVGGLTTAHVDAQLSRLWNQGADGIWMLLNEQEGRSMAHLAEASGSIIRVQATSDGKTVLGVKVTGYVHPVAGDVVPFLFSRFMSPGNMIFGSDRLPDGSPTMDVDVLPQVNLPQLAADEMIQGYVARELAPSLTAPDVFAFLCSVYETLRLKSALHVGKSTGITAV